MKIGMKMGDYVVVGFMREVRREVVVPEFVKSFEGEIERVTSEGDIQFVGGAFVVKGTGFSHVVVAEKPKKE